MAIESGEDESLPQDIETIALADEEGNETEFALLDRIEHGGESYIVLIPADEAFEGDDAEADDGASDDALIEDYDEDETVEVVILRVIGEGDETEYESVDDDALLDELFEEFHDRHVGEYEFE